LIQKQATAFGAQKRSLFGQCKYAHVRLTVD
jgi:hypothetical protein